MVISSIQGLLLVIIFSGNGLKQLHVKHMVSFINETVNTGFTHTKLLSWDNCRLCCTSCQQQLLGHLSLLTVDVVSLLRAESLIKLVWLIRSWTEMQSSKTNSWSTEMNYQLELKVCCSVLSMWALCKACGNREICSRSQGSKKITSFSFQRSGLGFAACSQCVFFETIVFSKYNSLQWVVTLREYPEYPALFV